MDSRNDKPGQDPAQGSRETVDRELASDHTEYESGARALKPAEGTKPQDAFSQDAAENRKPPLGIGLTEKADRERSEIDKSDLLDQRD